MRQNQNDPDFAFPLGNVLIWVTILSIFLMYPTSSFAPPQQLKSAGVISTNLSYSYTFFSKPDVQCSRYDLCILIHNIRTYAF